VFSFQVAEKNDKIKNSQFVLDAYHIALENILFELL
jgi:hypothetical protein